MVLPGRGEDGNCWVLTELGVILSSSPSLIETTYDCAARVPLHHHYATFEREFLVKYVLEL